MTSVATAPFAPVQAQPEIIETSTSYYEAYQENEDPVYNDVEMTDVSQKQMLEETGYEEQDTYNAEIESTVVEPPQSDAVMTHAPSTILDEMEYLEGEIDYGEDEETGPNKLSPDIHLIQDADTYKGDTTTAPTPPAHSPEDITHVQLFSPANRPVPLPRPQTPLIATFVGSTSAAATTGDADENTGGGVVVVVDDDWPICLYVPGGQEYMLFRSDGDTEALFEDNWLKSQPLETFFSSIRQTLENELIPLTTAFAMDEIVLAIPDLELSIAEDNCYTREISLQDLVNLINGLCAKNGTERPNVCKILLSFQQRFIARFNQLVALTSQSWETEKTTDESDGEGEEEEAVQAEPVEEEELHHFQEQEHPEQHYGEEEHHDETTDQVVADEGTQEVEYELYEDEQYDDVEDQGESAVKFRDPVEQVDDNAVDQGGEAELDAEEEDELYEENDETFDPGVQSTEALVNVMEEVGGEFQEHQYEEEDQVEQDYDRGAHGDEEGDYNADVASAHDSAAVAEEHPSASIQVQNGTSVWRSWSLTSSDSEVGNDDDDLISYEEAVDQTEDGQDYRQQYLAEEDSATAVAADDQTVHVNGHTDKQDEPSSIAPTIDVSAPDEGTTDKSQISENNAPTPKRPLDEVVDQTEEPPSKRAKP